MSLEELEAALTCINCGKPAWEVRPGKGGCLGTVIFEPGYDATREEPGEPDCTYLICAECEERKADSQAAEIERLRGTVAASAARIQELEGTVAALREIAIGERARYLADFIHEYDTYDDPSEDSAEARRHLAKEHPEVDWK